MLVCLLATESLASAATISVSAGGDLQKALNAAKPGDVILLEPGATFVGNFYLPNKGAIDEFITIRSAAPDADLPGAGIRITPAYAALLPKIKSSNNMSALRTAAGANHWRLLFLEFPGNVGGFGEIIALGAGDATQTMLSQVPYALMLDRVYVHGHPVFGQKRGIALNSRDTDIVNSYVSDCKAIGQDSQAIGSYNGPGDFRIENNYLEGAAENVLFGGSDPTIPDLVPTNITFRHNHLFKPLAWRTPIVGTPTGVQAAVVPGGSLIAGTYAYRVAARLTSQQNLKATSASSIEVSATIEVGATGSVRLSWTPVAGAEQYLVYGRIPGGQTMYWKTSDTFFMDGGIAGTAVGTPSTNEKPTYGGTKWAVKNTFELKNAQDVLVEGNVFENLWFADQAGFPIVFTPRNQDGRAPWTVVQRVIFRHNLVRHTAGGVNILGTDDLKPSLRTNAITVRDNVFDDLTAATWGSGSRPLMLGDGPDGVTFDHNTIFSTDAHFIWLYGGSAVTPKAVTRAVVTNNMAAHNTYGIMASGMTFGNPSITAYLPGVGNVTANVIAGGGASRYPAGNLFPSLATWKSNFPNYASGDYRLKDDSVHKYAGLDGKDLGADVDALNKHVPIALSGRDDASVLKILPATLADGVFGEPYSESLSCGGNTGACVFSLIAGSLPAGLSFDAAAGLISGIPTEADTRSITIAAYDSMWSQNAASATVTVRIAPPTMRIVLPAAAEAQVGHQFAMTAAVSGAMGAATWSLVSGALPPGTVLDELSGTITGVPSVPGEFAPTIAARDSWTEPRTASAPTKIVVLPANLTIDAISLPNATAGAPYSAAFSTTGGTGTAAWSLKAGPLPDGMTVDAHGVLSGTPASAATYIFTVRAVDAIYAQMAAELTLQLTVKAPVVLEVTAPEIVLNAADATKIAGTWSLVADTSAAGGKRIWNKDAAAPKLTAALASPVNYFELTFDAEAHVGYHLWLRGKADANSWANDSVFVQFSGSVNASGAQINRIGTTGAATVSIEEGTGAGVAGWGWADDSYGALAAPHYFAAAGPQTIRIQVREDGLSLDQIVLSSDRFSTRAPGKTKNDATILSRDVAQPTLSIGAAVLANATYGAPYTAGLAATGSTGSTIWSIVSGALPAGLTLSPSGTVSGTPTVLGDFSFSVQAQDAAWRANMATAPVTLTVAAAVFSVAAPAMSPAMVERPFSAAFTSTGSVGNVVWTVASGTLPAGLALDAAGTIGGQPTMWGMSAVLVQGADSLGRVASAPLTIVVAPRPIAVTTTTLAAAHYKQAYSAALATTGGTGAVSWVIAPGVLPAGLTLDASGVLSGTPTEPGSFVFDVQAVDSNWEGDSASRPLTLEVQPPAFSAAIAPATVSGRVGVAIQPVVGSAAGNVGTVNWSLASGVLPAGVVLDATAGRITGTPAVFGRFSADVKAEDSWGAARAVVSRIAIEVAPAALAVTTTTVAPASVGHAYSTTLSSSGGTGVTTWSVAGALPEGMTLNPDGTLAGTPMSVGTFVVAVQASDAGWAGNVATANLQLKVGSREIVLYAADAARIGGTWARVADAMAAGGVRVANPDANGAKPAMALASPANYFELSFQAEAGVAYHMWLRGKADKNGWQNDSAFVQFSGSVNASGVPVNRIGTTAAAVVSIEEGTGAGLSGWGWADDSYGSLAGAMYFASGGVQTIRIQVREDGLSLDQIVLSADRFVTSAPGATKNDAVVLAR